MDAILFCFYSVFSQSYLVLIVPSLYQVRTFKASHFYTIYPDVKIPHMQHVIFTCAEAIIQWFYKRHHIEISIGRNFLRELQREAFEKGVVLLDNVPAACQFIWTSAQALRDGSPEGREFCSILNEAIREDDAELMRDGATLTRGLNDSCVTRNGGLIVWPQDFCLYRGGGMPDEHQGMRNDRNIQYIQ